MKCQLGKIAVHYEMWGDGRPVVLLHGFWTDHRQMGGCLEPLFNDRAGWKWIYLDLPGMGKTPGEEWIANSDQMLDVVCEWIDAVLPGTNFVVGGYSYGAYLAQGVVHRRSAQVDGLVLLCPVVVPNTADRTVPPSEILIKDPELVAGLSPEQREEFEHWVAVESPRILQRTNAEVDAGSRLADEPFLTRLQAEGYGFSFDLQISAEPCHKPALIIAGRQDWVVGYQDSWKTIEQYPRATFAVLDRAGHNLPISQEGLFNMLVGEWLDRVEESYL